ncbi:hypothetical protein [Legionella fallonii]|uniref:Uncharacterized protein n=1 Tax=Legionella fallonii LLAP-10 TaxID=1212491 RepID=A0A098GAH1_9GAMM|nr:hypothetical protein [Legionella fallonii]CEG58480.1 conserved protein of unknown function [Legionella fallonii LLAP-10]
MTLQPFQKAEEVEKLQFFQNLVPGQQKSDFINRYQAECLPEDNEENAERRQLLNHFPPVLSFYEQQKKKFYEKEAQDCKQFCCGSMSMNMNGDKAVLEPADNYMLSIGSGKLYQGSADTIKHSMQSDIRQASSPNGGSLPFGSPQQAQAIDGLRQFENIVAQREQGNTPAQADMTQDQKFNPFQTAPKPTKD